MRLKKKKDWYLQLLFFVGCFSFLQAQTTNYAASRTPGELAVSPTGAATYLVPIALPPGIKEVVPSLALNYNSQGGDGIAGWGWNVAGLSTITRVGATRFHDGVMDPVDFDALDRYALDGQRLLIKSGDHHESNSEYQTETYSNLKIVAKGSSGGFPLYFIVYHPDGSRSWYGVGNAKNDLEWAISAWEDPQGNRIDYSYEQDDNLLRIKTISYGNQSKDSHPNVVEFHYKDRHQVQTSYVEGKKYSRKQLLSTISVCTFGNSYRTYSLSHDVSQLGYERLQDVVEVNAQGHSKPPLVFEYGSASGAEATTRSYGAPAFNEQQYEKAGRMAPKFDYDREKHTLIPGDFNGDGYSDMIFQENASGDFTVFFSNTNSQKPFQPDRSYSFANTEGTKFLAATYQTEDNLLLSRQGFTTVEDKPVTGPPTTQSNIPQEYFHMVFRTHALNAQGDALLPVYEKRWDNKQYSNTYYCGGEAKAERILKDYYPIDYDGNGIQDVLMIEKAYSLKQCNYTNGTVSGAEMQYERRLFLVDMDRNKERDFVHPIGTLTIKGGDTIRLADYNGDGIADVWHFSEENLKVYAFDKGGIKTLMEYDHRNLRQIENSFHLGDFNGDGKTDLLVEKDFVSAINDLEITNGGDTTAWYLFYNTGKGFSMERISALSLPKPKDNSYFTAQDINGDGISDMLLQELEDLKITLTVFENKARTQNAIDVEFINPPLSQRVFLDRASHTFSVAEYGSALPIDVHRNHYRPVYSYISGDKIHQYVFKQHYRDELQLKSISHKGLSQTLSYEPLVTTGGNVYTGDASQIYPYVNVNNALDLQQNMVEKS